MSELISVYRSGNILARSINWNACSWRRRRRYAIPSKDWVAVSNGQLGGTWAYMTGRLKIRGDQGLARKLGQIFP